jgi:crotonobetainyl-CoA:carnitine CoA-transferase CaiB-like acyl-CoA transferase
VKPLEGVRVLDLTRLLPGAVATMILRDAGADVLKVEEPGRGDYARSMPPLVDGVGALFLATNQGKRSVRLDLKSAAGRDSLLAMAPDADVLVEGFRPGVMERLGLGADVLAQAAPRLIYASLTGWPRGSPDAGRAGHDLNYLADAGLLGWPPTMPAAQIADICGGSMQLVNRILLALIERSRTGLGSRVDVSMVEGLAPLAIAPRAFADAGAVNPLSGAHPCYRLYRAADGWVALGALESRFWGEFCGAVGRPEWVARQWDGALVAEVESMFRGRRAAEWVALCSGRDCCLTEVRERPRSGPGSG